MTTPTQDSKRPLDLDQIRELLESRPKKAYWRSLDELAETEQFDEFIRQEFPRQAQLLGTLNRRDFLKVLGASLALAGMTACTPQAADKIVPYVRPPEELVPGKPMYFASTMPFGGYGQGVVVKSDMGRPIKVDGNPRHPATVGGSDIFMQASILDLYDPDRAKVPTNKGAESTWEAFATALSQAVGGAQGGAGLRLLTGPVTSPSLSRQLQALLGQFPDARWVPYSGSGGNSRAALNALFGAPVDAVYALDRAEVILSLDADFLFREPGSLRYGRDFGLRHQPISTLGTMNRLYVVESSLTLTGANADHRLPVRPSQVEAFARAVASRLGVAEAGQPAGDIPGQEWIEPLVADLQRAGQAALVVAGDRQPPAVHALAHAMNQALGAAGSTVTYIEPVEFAPETGTASLAELVQDLNAGSVSALIILDGNPVYTAPADLALGEAIAKAPFSVYLGLRPDETSAVTTWHIPMSHYLEAWGDARTFDGTASIIQPLIQPLYNSKSPVELLAAVMGQPDAKGYDLVRAGWQEQMGAGFDRAWRQALSDGIIPDTAAKAASGGITGLAGLLSASPAAAPAGGDTLEVVFEPDPTVWDGEFSNNAWLQELPKPLTKLTWGNAAFISPRTATRLNLNEEDVAVFELRGRSLEAPVMIVPGHPDDTVTLTLGYGRSKGGELLEGRGYNANAIRTSEAPWMDTGLTVRAVGRTQNLITTRDHWSMENRDLVHSATLDEYNQNPEFAQEHETPPLSLYPEWPNEGYAWGMAINQNTCIGCNACVISCQAENNIPTVGPEEVERSREMHWLRIDRYFSGPVERPAIFFQPMLCQHCENAPCEPVCPVEATSHSAEGLNEMTYNRCVGTRYCSNNCPYKVRRFNFFKYIDDTSASLKAMRNPDVTVRMRGVMEKCTYCVQRINHARIQADTENREIQDGEVVTACQAACPTQAIVFGNINDPNSQVRKLKDNPLNYGVLTELGTKPRTTYLAKVTNPNPMIKEAQG